MIKNVLLDWSGTVVDDLPPVIHATNAILFEYGIPELSRDEFRARFRLPFSEFYHEILPGVPMAQLEALYLKFFGDLSNTVVLLPGAMEFLECCRETKKRVFLLSTIKSEHFETQAGLLGVRDFFEYPYVEVMDKRARIQSILEERGLNAAETLFAGDMVHDIETAKAGGVLSVAVLTGFDPLEKLTPAEPDIIVQNLSKLIPLMDTA